MNSEESIKNLIEGNKRFIDGKQKAKNFSTKRKELAKGQHPYAIVVTCSDSRVVPEYIFDADLGEIFTVISAGNVVDNIGLGSIEYAAAHLHVPLIAVMCHEKCGAVTAAYDDHKESHITDIVQKIKPAVAKIKKTADKAKDIENLANENVKCVIEEIKKSPIIKEEISKGNLKIIGLKYQLESGKIEQTI